MQELHDTAIEFVAKRVCPDGWEILGVELDRETFVVEVFLGRVEDKTITVVSFVAAAMEVDPMQFVDQLDRAIDKAVREAE